MPVVSKRFVGTDVLVEAKRRIHHIFDQHDVVVVAFSGGKDSLAVLHLVREVVRERGLPDQVEVVHRDFEFFVGSLVDFVCSVRELPWVNMLYMAVQRKSTTLVLGNPRPLVFWDESRRWVREKPAFAFGGDGEMFSVESMDEEVAGFHAGLVAVLTGVRASESMYRYRASVNKVFDNYINRSGSERVNLCKPIFDWQDNDVLRYLWEQNVPLPVSYFEQFYARVPLRTATVLHHSAVAHLGSLAEIDPVLYENILDVFPALRLQAVYGDEFNVERIWGRYGRSYVHVRQWIEDNLGGDAKAQALWCFNNAMPRAERWPHLYSPETMLKHLMRGEYNKKIQPNVRLPRGTR